MRLQAGAEQSPQYVDLNLIYAELKQQYNEVYLFQAEGEMFLYKPLGRKAYKDIIESDQVNDLEKEEIICAECVLWPENYDFENCDAGIPTQLAQAILKNSFLTSLEDRQLLIDICRQEMYELDNQVTCIINEAFPNYDIEEIETWDLQKTAKYLSRAEWKLANLRGAQFSHDPFTGKTPEQILAEQEAAAQAAETTEIEELSPLQQGKTETVEERQKRLAKQGPTKQRLTPEKLAELKAKYPEMEWGSNVFEDMSVDSLRESVSTDSPALRIGQ